MQLNLHTVGVNPAGRGTVMYQIPADRELLAPKIRKALDACLTAEATAQTINRKTSSTRDQKIAAAETVTDTWNNLVDTAAGTSATTAAHHRDEYGIAAARYERARQQMLSALHDAGVHANLHRVATSYPSAIGVDKALNDPLFGHVMALASQVETLQLRALDA
ncbi:hypothetical protein [Kitasatospora terrestris]|uniref:Uncharacterized protein n=1 Tax=Kitasatospora terrestris TaxID=258051 RepID=A0ABP9E842_9ACTN